MLIDSSVAVRSPLVRKGIAVAMQVPRSVARVRASAGDYRLHPPVIADSIPKSGTHLLLQVVRGLPGTRYYGTFVGWAASFRLVARTQEAITQRVRALVPGEAAAAHLHYSIETAAAMRDRNAVHVFIVRDPRDLVVSEAQYLAFMNRWHYMHAFFRSVNDHDVRIRMIIDGVDAARGRFPDLRSRLTPYLGWLDHDDTLVVRYEDLAGPSRESVMEAIAARYRSLGGGQGESAASLVPRMLASIDPARSHTFRSGGQGNWRKKLNDANRCRIEALVGDIIARLGYET